MTNGKLVIMYYKRNLHFFDLSTGIRLAKEPLNDGLKKEKDGIMCYDHFNHRLWYLNRVDVELYSCIQPNFKRIVVEENEFQKNFLKKRVSDTRTKAPI